MIVLCHWILLKCGCVIQNQPTEEIIEWNMSTDKTLVINYVREKLEFEAVFAWNKDQHGGSTNAYCITFRRGVNQVMIPLNTYITGLHDLSTLVQHFSGIFQLGFTSFVKKCASTDRNTVDEREPEEEIVVD